MRPEGEPAAEVNAEPSGKPGRLQFLRRASAIFTRPRIRRFGTRVTALVLVLTMALTPLSPLMTVKTFAPVTPAVADPVDDLKACLGTFKSAVDSVETIAGALANPEYVACMAEAASLNPLTIAMMGAVTALWATDTSAFNSPEQCLEFLPKTLMGLVAKGLSDAIGDGKGIVADVLSGLFGDAGLELIQKIAVALGGEDYEKQFTAEAIKAIQDVLDDLIKEVTTALGPLMHYLNCGCMAAGTVAIIKNTIEGVAANAGACWSILKDPGALIKAFFADPLGTLGAVGGAICDGMAEVVDVCGAVGAVVDFFKDLVAAAGGVILETAEDIYCFFAGPFGGCDDDPPPQPPPTPQCSPEVLIANPQQCICPAVIDGKGTYGYSTYTVQTDCGLGACSNYDGYTCLQCGPNEGRDKFGFCAKCPVGFKTGADGTCSQFYSCPPGQHYNHYNTGCFACPAGMEFTSDGQHCRETCPSYLIYDEKASSYTANSKLQQAGLDGSYAAGGACVCAGANQYDTGTACVEKKECPKEPGVYFSESTGKCERECADNEVVVSGEFPCKKCDEGLVAINNVCHKPGYTAVCGKNEIHIADVCVTCPDGTVKAEGERCDAICPAGSQPKPDKAASSSKGVGAALSASQPLLDLSKSGSLAGKAVTEAAKNSAKLGEQIKTEKQTAGSHTAPNKLPEECVPCAENQETVYGTISGAGWVITTIACIQCKEGEVSKGGTDSCHKPGISFVLTAKPEREQRKSTDGTPSLPKGKDTGPVTTTKALPKAKTTCPPGQIPEGGACVYPRTKGAPVAPQLTLPNQNSGSTAPALTLPGGGPSGFSTSPRLTAPPPPAAGGKPF